MSYYKCRMRKLLSCRAGDWLLHRHWPRTFAVCVIGCQVYCGILNWHYMGQLGINNPVLITSASMLVAYLTYLLLTTIWLVLTPPVEAKLLLIDSGREVRTSVPGETEFDKSLDLQVECQMRQEQAKGNPAAFLIMAGVLGCFYVAAHFVYHAPWYLGQMLVDSGKVRHRSVSRMGRYECLFVSLEQSWLVAMFLVVHCTLLAITVHAAKR